MGSTLAVQFVVLHVCCCAEELQELHKKEKEMKVQPDWEIDAFTKAQIRTGKRHSIVTDLILKLLGLDVSLAVTAVTLAWVDLGFSLCAHTSGLCHLLSVLPLAASQQLSVQGHFTMQMQDVCK